jgi:asparagine synthase (glutamine-hydrolysing)
MCGIIGVIGQKISIDSDIKGRLLESIAHRGPDGHGSWESSNPPVWLGHTRLSILDLTDTASQPMLSDCGRWVLVFNGEIFNFLELRADLIKRGFSFRTESDTEVLLKGLICFGPDFQLQCNGMWAFCLWDSLEQTALFGRDRFGKKPLYWTRLSTGIAFASEMKGLYPLLDFVEPSQNIEAAFANMFAYEATDWCPIRGISKIPPGHIASYKNGDFQLKRWWNTLEHLREIRIPYEEQVEEFKGLFLDSVRIRMRADVRIGTALSGGLDSSSVFCTMAALMGAKQSATPQERISGDWQHGVCANFPGSSLDEAHWARLVTDSIGVPLELVPTDPVNAGWTIEEALFQVEDPYITLPLPQLATYRKISQLGIKVTLDGHGADELFSGYGHLNAALLDANVSQASEILAIQRSLTGRQYELSSEGVVHAMAKERLKKIAKRILGSLGRAGDLVNLDKHDARYRQMDALTKSLYEIFHFSIMPTLLRNYDRYSMASGVEIRMPFMDHRIVTYCFSLPWTSKVGGGYTKRILRDAMKGIVPDEVRLRRDKIGWNAPMHEWLAGPLRPEVESILSLPGVGSRLAPIIQGFLKKPNPSYLDGERLWSDLMPIFWRESLKSHV